MNVKLAASLIVRNELGRYLAPCLEHLLAFCDEVHLLDDASDDGTDAFLAGYGDDRLRVLTSASPTFFAHEGAARQALLDFTMAQEPSHILAIDADEFVADGAAVRHACSGRHQVFGLEMEEVWQADEQELRIRMDGGWRSHPVPILYALPPARWRTNRRGEWRIPNRALASGRTPVAISRAGGRPREPVTEILHFGWTDEANRAARYERYVEHDGGKFHASAHLRSIMWPDRKVELRPRPWPPALEALRPLLVPRDTGETEPR